MSFLGELFGGQSAATPGFNPGAGLSSPMVPTPGPVAPSTNYNPAFGALGLGLSQLAAGQPANILGTHAQLEEYAYQKAQRERDDKAWEEWENGQDRLAEKAEKSGSTNSAAAIREATETAKAERDAQVAKQEAAESMARAFSPISENAFNQAAGIKKEAAEAGGPPPAALPGILPGTIGPAIGADPQRTTPVAVQPAATTAAAPAAAQPAPMTAEFPIAAQGMRAALQGPYGQTPADMQPASDGMTPAASQAQAAAARQGMNPQAALQGPYAAHPQMLGPRVTAAPAADEPTAAPAPVMYKARPNPVVEAVTDVAERAVEGVVEAVTGPGKRRKADEAKADRPGNVEFGEAGRANSRQTRDIARRIMRERKVPVHVQNSVMQAAYKYNIPVGILAGLITQESQWNEMAVSEAGAKGLMQIMDGTAGDLGLKGDDVFIPSKAIPAGAKYLREQFDRFGNWNDALIAYNAGHGKLQKVKEGKDTLRQESIEYVPRIMEWMGLNAANAAKGPSGSAPVSAPGPVSGKADTGNAGMSAQDEMEVSAFADEEIADEGEIYIEDVYDEGAEDTAAPAPGPVQQAAATDETGSAEAPVEPAAQAAAAIAQTTQAAATPEPTVAPYRADQNQGQGPTMRAAETLTRMDNQMIEQARQSGKDTPASVVSRASGGMFTPEQVRFARMLGRRKGTEYLAKLSTTGQNTPYGVMKDAQNNLIAYNRRNPRDHYRIGAPSTGTLSALGKEMMDRNLDPSNPEHVSRVLTEKALLKRAGATNVTVGGNTQLPQYPKLEPGYMYRRYPRGHAREGQVMVDKNGIAEVVPIKGSKAEQEQIKLRDANEANAGKVSKRVGQKAQTDFIITEDITRALNTINDPTNFGGIDWSTGILGLASAYIPETPAWDLREMLETVKANVGFGKLGEMRETSETGGALGQVSNFENALLQKTSGSLDQYQSREELIYNLQRLKAMRELIWTGGISDNGRMISGRYQGLTWQQALHTKMASEGVQLPPSMIGPTQRQADDIKSMTDAEVKAALAAQGG